MDVWYIEAIARHILAMKKEYWWRNVLEDTQSCILLGIPWTFDADLVDEALGDMVMDNLSFRIPNVQEIHDKAKQLVLKYIPLEYMDDCAFATVYIYETNTIKVQLNHVQQ